MEEPEFKITDSKEDIIKNVDKFLLGVSIAMRKDFEKTKKDVNAMVELFKTMSGN